MAIITGLMRLGRDAVLRHTADGQPVLELALAYNHGRKDGQGNRPTQWVEAALWGKRAEALAPHLTKGSAIDVVLTDPHVETWTKKDGATGFKLAGKVSEIEFAGGGSKPAGNSAPASRPAAAPEASGFDDQDIPF